MRKAFLTILFFVVVAAVLTSQTTTRPRLKPQPAPAATPVDTCADTIAGDDIDFAVNFTGYEKPLRSARESVIVNNVDTLFRTLTAVIFRIDYYTMNGTQLHSRQLTLPVDVPAGESRMLTFKTWDVQRLFYYHLNKPTRTTAQATPYTVILTPLQATMHR